MNETSEDVSAPIRVENDDGLWPRQPLFVWRSLVEGAVGAMLVVVTDVDREDSFEVPSVDDQDPVETLARYGAD